MSLTNTVSTDLQTEISRLKNLLDQARTTIINQANTIAQHVATLNTANTVVGQVTADLKSKLDEFETLFTGNGVANQIINTVSKEVANVVQTVLPVAANLVVTTATPAVNAVVTALNTALHDIANATSNAVPATLHNLQELEKAYASIMANATVSTLPAHVALPSQVEAIVNTAKTNTSGIFGEGLGLVENVATDVKDAVENVVEGKVSIGPLKI